MAPDIAYLELMRVIRARLLLGAAVSPDEHPLFRAERLALQVRKVVEGVTFDALSGVEARNGQGLAALRTKDADQLLTWLEKKRLLHLPAAQRLVKPVEGYKMVLEGGAGAAAGYDIDSTELKQMFSRASGLVHERHPERTTAASLAAETDTLEEDLRRLREWLWLHIMFLRGEGYLIQMGQYGTPSFMVPLSKQSDLPPELA